MIVAMLLALGPWEVDVPVEGLNRANGEGLQARLSAHFKTLKDSDGRPCEIRVEVNGCSGSTRLTIDCPMDELRLSDVRKALEGTEWSVKPEAWALYGRVGFRWEDKRTLDERALERDLAKHSLVADVMLIGDGKKFAYHAYVRFGEDQKSTAADLLGVLSKHGVKEPEIFWAKQPPNQPGRTACGAAWCAELK
jgi:hypothetical protein